MNKRRSITVFAAAICMVILILDSHTAIAGATAGIDICIKTLIPSLLPFFVLSILLTTSLLGQPLRFLRPASDFCRIPPGSESLLVIGFLGGYPVGAQNVFLAWEQGAISEKDARRMAVFCNNAGPSFIFGFLGTVFDNSFCPWVLWLVQIMSALLTGFILPGGSRKPACTMKTTQVSLPEALNRSIRVMAGVCGWVILFRIVLEFFRKWIFWRFPISIQIILTGILELSNGCILLRNIPSEGGKLVVSSLILGFGGLCVSLQTHSMAKNLSLRLYLPGKLLHGGISFLIAYGIQFLFLQENSLHIPPIIPASTGILIILFSMIIRKIEKPVAISDDLLYNRESCEKRRTICCFGKRSKNPVPTAVTAPN